MVDKLLLRVIYCSGPRRSFAPSNPNKQIFLGCLSTRASSSPSESTHVDLRGFRRLGIRAFAQRSHRNGRGDESHFSPFCGLSIYNHKARGVDGGLRLGSQFNELFEFLGAKCT
jgi:hypothetical protein